MGKKKTPEQQISSQSGELLAPLPDRSHSLTEQKTHRVVSGLFQRTMKGFHHVADAVGTVAQEPPTPTSTPTPICFNARFLLLFES